MDGEGRPAVRARHTAQAVNERFEPVLAGTFATDAGEIDRFMERLRRVAPEGTTFRFVIEPTASVWKIVARFLRSRGHEVYQATADQVQGMRQVMGQRRRKRDGLDATALALLPAVSPDHVRPVLLPPDFRWARLQRGVRREHKLASRIGNMIKELQALADEPVPGLGRYLRDPKEPVAMAVCRHWAHAGRLAEIGPEALAAELARRSGHGVPNEVAQRLVDLGRRAVALGCGCDP